MEMLCGKTALCSQMLTVCKYIDALLLVVWPCRVTGGQRELDLCLGLIYLHTLAV